MPATHSLLPDRLTTDYVEAIEDTYGNGQGVVKAASGLFEPQVYGTYDRINTRWFSALPDYLILLCASIS